MSETICAIATATGGALGIIRISGQEAIEIASNIFIPKNRKQSFAEMHNNYTVFGLIKDGDETLDEAMATKFQAPHSYTGEDSVEFSCHGSAYILNRVIQILVSKGCRLANPGEFTERAFLNGKIDLSQAEAVADLIASRSKVAHKVAMNQLKGGFKDRIAELRKKLLNIQSLLELELDFSDHEDLEFADRTKLISLAEEIKKEMESLIHSFTSLNTVKSGIPVAIIGNTNVGKSTLMNALLSDSRAIVSDIAGTTRDTIEEPLIINGVEFRLIDTAGIRETNDVVEKLGINKTFQVIDNSPIIIWVVSAPDILKGESSGYDKEITRIFKKEKKLIIVINKIDVLSNDESKEKAELIIKELINKIYKSDSKIEYGCKTKQVSIVMTSAKNGKGLGSLEKELSNAAHIDETAPADIIVVNERHYQALSKAVINIKSVIDGMNNHLSADLISQDLRETNFHLSSISGEITSQDVLNNIFSNFCIGK